MVATIGRCVWFTDTRLPTMNSAYAEITIALALHLYILYLCYRFKDSLYREPPLYERWYVTVAIAALLSCILHPGAKGKYFVTQQMFVSFTMFTEALSLISQLAHMQTLMAVEGLNTGYLIVLGLSRFSRIFFWY